MGLLKRLFSIGSKKDKQAKKRPVIVHNVPVQDARVRPVDDEDHEAAVGRLLRSSSARYAVAHELDYASLPPLPHPINKVVQPPASSTVSIASSSVSQRGTYTVTVHGRKRHASTEFPLANRHLDNELTTPVRILSASTPPEDDSRALRLRSDPSVLSLLDMYDEHGRLPSKAFSNSPPKEERAQCRRNGSTLRQLLGAPNSLTSGDENNSAMEGDISWAERFLEDADSITSASSLGLPTPQASDAHFGDSFQRPNVHHDITISTDDDLSTAFDNPAISSMDVELSITTDSSRILDEPIKENNPYGSAIPTTPHRASQIFGFLTDRRRSKTLPDPPSVFSSPSDDGASHHGFISRFSSDSSSESVHPPSKDSAIPRSRSSDTHRRSRRISTSSISTPMPLTKRPSRSNIPERPASVVRTPRSIRRDSFLADHTYDQTQDDDAEEPNIQQVQKVKVIMTGPTKVIVTAPTPSQNHNTPSRIPRGPRGPSKRSSKDFKPARRMLTDYGNSSGSEPVLRGDALTQIPSRRQARQRSASQTSTSTASLRENAISIARPIEKTSKSRKDVGASRPVPQDKENQLRLSVKSEIPLTPLRTNSSSANRSPLFRTAVHHGVFKPPAGMTPSPASSSELSPLGKKIMIDVRQQRLAAREADREKGARYAKRSGSGKSAVRF